MRIVESKEQTVIVKNVKEVKCNCCGNLIEPKGYNPYDLGHEFNLQFGCDSEYTDQKWGFDLCESCLTNIIKTFKIVPNGFMKRLQGLYQSDGDHEVEQQLFENWKQTGEWNEEEINYFDKNYEDSLFLMFCAGLNAVAIALYYPKETKTESK